MGAKEYVIDESFIRELSEIRKLLYDARDFAYRDKLDVNEGNCTYALFGDNDELLDHYNDFCKWYLLKHAYTSARGHRLETDTIKDVLIPLINKVLETKVSLFYFEND